MKWEEIVDWDIEESSIKSIDNSSRETCDSNEKKLRLVQEMRSQGVRGRDLSGANLRDANVENARFEGSFGITEQMKQDLIQRGAIFNDSPGDRSKSLVHKPRLSTMGSFEGEA